MGNEHVDVLVLDNDSVVRDILSRCLGRKGKTTFHTDSLDSLARDIVQYTPEIVVVGNNTREAFNILDSPELSHVPAVIYSAIERDRDVAREHHVPYYEKGRVSPVGLSHEIINILNRVKK